MVCYGGGGKGGVGYAAAQSLGKVQWEINQELATKVSSPEAAATEVDLDLAARLIDEKLAPLQQQLGIDLATVSHHE
jgi:kynurenine 3-monooxygenase